MDERVLRSAFLKFIERRTHYCFMYSLRPNGFVRSVFIPCSYMYSFRRMFHKEFED